MAIDRRDYLRGMGAIGLTLAMPTPLWSQSNVIAGQARLDTLSDGNLVLPKSFILGEMSPPGADEILTRYGLAGDTLTPDCNVTLFRDGTRTVLFDAGAGADFMPTTGRLIEAFDTLGVDPFDVTDVVFTHAHPDHIWGLLDDFGDLSFPEADYHIGADEFAYWTDPNTVSTIGTERQSFAVGAANRLAEIADRIILFDDGAEVLPGIHSRATPGHTPGHMAFVVTVGREEIMVVGDAIGNHHIAFERPGWISGSDQDGTLGAKTRQMLLDQLAHDQMRFVGFHLPNGGLGRAEKRDEGFVFVGEDS
ncbi:Glyoxylase, beta-lactamase superfamily II [Cognatiyoonia koreensis]|uniref:Glyoxylase, beta-lactamase superfamily II n=1 Tax=Cognatiyoonia koreensis TaxID=364200 RepID=A0A1I0PYZ2_9RHOB|nr:MBL fold metallo-hydrolase [Cognatiyoonia koreensis]SEW19778.1 Glyoxylase, beta-lactamase superfamily II [Cognatiyoonia koreensis]